MDIFKGRQTVSEQKRPAKIRLCVRFLVFRMLLFADLKQIVGLFYSFLPHKASVGLLEEIRVRLKGGVGLF